MEFAMKKRRRLPGIADCGFWQLCRDVFRGVFTNRQVQSKFHYLHRRFCHFASAGLCNLRVTNLEKKGGHGAPPFFSRFGCVCVLGASLASKGATSNMAQLTSLAIQIWKKKGGHGAPPSSARARTMGGLHVPPFFFQIGMCVCVGSFFFQIGMCVCVGSFCDIIYII